MILASTRRTLIKGSVALITAPVIIRAVMRSSNASMADPTEGRSLVFDEPFVTLDPSVWDAGPKATTLEPGFYGRSAFARITGEEGFNPYSIVEDPSATDRKALQISVKYIGQAMKVPNYYGNNHREFQWVSGNIQTARRDGTITKGWRQGYFEARMWVPKHPLTWSAFWLMNGRSILWPQTSIEIDAMEHKGFEPTLYGTYLHEWGKPDEHHEGIGVPTGLDVTQGYYRYGVLIEGAECTPYFERRPALQSGTDQPIRWTIGRSAEMDEQKDVLWPLLTLALRSDVQFPSALQEEDKLAHLRIDYFRVYA
ncbi:1,3-beta-glucanase [Microvirga sp. KLBC 81]|uniref:glycoside hydrolase family 16 protein n=1 Tax=Microvirga sp. KLBC 81 TaxID=1862707 RepID=UPI000D50D1B7|nr:family 16 glycosylhydrolase [Microvirga sp. KLBC 81]PVE20649.1 1,3-beta-glucanase [Microvirga sp. KLBC 81]